MTTDELVVLTNFLVAFTSILVAAASEHDTVKHMSRTVIELAKTAFTRKSTTTTDGDNGADTTETENDK